MLNIKVILGSTRENRQGEKVAKWVLDQLSQKNDIELELIDLKDWDLPFYNEAASPAALKGNYKNETAKKFSQKIGQADGYIIVTPEYNHSFSAVLKNALDWVYYEWNRKPVGIVSYSGAATGGSRAVEQLRLVVVELQMTPIRSAVHISGVNKFCEEEAEMTEEDLKKLSDYNQKLEGLYHDLIWWTEVLKKAREK